LIDLPLSTSGLIVQILMNADLEEAVAILTKPGEELEMPDVMTQKPGIHKTTDFWRWRMQMAEKISLGINPDQYDVRAVYLIGSTKNASAAPSSDIDLLIHFEGDERQREELSTWLDGWSQALAEINYMRTGYRTDGLLDVRFVNDDDISNHKGYAAKINAATDPALQLPMIKK
jgi:predicted nucleotidyltransferase